MLFNASFFLVFVLDVRLINAIMCEFPALSSPRAIQNWLDLCKVSFL